MPKRSERTPTKQRPRRGQAAPRGRRRGDRHESPDQDHSRRGRRQKDDDTAEKLERRVPGVQVIGWAFVLLVLAGYFVWLCAEMGGHALTGAGPLIGIFGAAIVGCAVAGLALRGGGGNNRG